MIRDLCVEAKRLLKLRCIFNFVPNYEEGCEHSHKATSSMPKHERRLGNYTHLN
jgi:hypothetical protein